MPLFALHRIVLEDRSGEHGLGKDLFGPGGTQRADSGPHVDLQELRLVLMLCHGFPSQMKASTRQVVELLLTHLVVSPHTALSRNWSKGVRSLLRSRS
ncbi:hypothetical protein PV367_22060 [Streptomyces europaeiscabiei]|uniref:Uncharacterized protein n=1 Tax=Streptomyces europaeiscabiei TaxID=146819 RepID=A0AAJ2UN06_9ACTN|nr:hypothetical protein [Streptomyces europaeiscabiei]MDX3132419.1 hypothetical protein [Streptomyces europaeiscabiei]